LEIAEKERKKNFSGGNWLVMKDSRCF